MDKQTKLIDADKLLAHINSIRNDHIEKRNEGDECDRFANDAVADWLFIISNDIEKGIFDPDPIPLPTIKPGDKVRHSYYGLGAVQEALDSKHVIVKYYSGEICVITNVIDLEVISHD